MVINIHGTGIELTPALREYAEEKIRGFDKFFDNIIQADIDIGMRSQHHQHGNIFYAEVNVFLPQKRMLRVVKDAEDLYKAIDKVRDHFKVELGKIKGKMRHKDKEELRESKAYHIED